jgi:hypothetical protein
MTTPIWFNFKFKLDKKSDLKILKLIYNIIFNKNIK